MNLELDQKVIIITGGSGGLGAATAASLAREGASIALCARDEATLTATAEELRTTLGADVLAVPADVTSIDDLTRFVAAVVDRWGHIDGVVNNAGTSARGSFAATTDQQWTDDLDLKLLAAVRCCRLALPHLQPGSAIVNVLNLGAKAPQAASMPTSVSRAAGLAFTKALSRDLAPSGVRVNGVLVGLIESGQWERRAAAAGVPLEEFYLDAAADAAVPLGRVGRADEFADLVTYLLSTRASYLTGTAVNVDGGLCAVT